MKRKLLVMLVALAAALALAITALAASEAVTSIPAGEDEGMVDTEWFKTKVADLPGNVAIVDVRSPEEFAAGHVDGAVNIPAELAFQDGGCKKFADRLPRDKFVIFHCLGGSKSGGVYFELKEKCKYPGIEKLFYLGATITFKDGKPVIAD